MFGEIIEEFAEDKKPNSQKSNADKTAIASQNAAHPPASKDKLSKDLTTTKECIIVPTEDKKHHSGHRQTHALFG